MSFPPAMPTLMGDPFLARPFRAGSGDTGETTMGGLFVMFAGLFPRFGVFIIWLARPAMFSAAFGDMIIWPLLGIVFAPFTTLMYVLLWSPTGLTGWDFLWLGLALVIDIGHWGSSAYTNRDRIPGYGTGGSSSV